MGKPGAFLEEARGLPQGNRTLRTSPCRAVTVQGTCPAQGWLWFEPVLPSWSHSDSGQPPGLSPCLGLGQPGQHRRGG